MWFLLNADNSVEVDFEYFPQSHFFLDTSLSVKLSAITPIFFSMDVVDILASPRVCV